MSAAAAAPGAGGGKDAPEGLPGDSLAERIDRIRESARDSDSDVYSDDLASHYSALSENADRDQQAREGALLFSVAEEHLDCERGDEALKASGEALALFREKGDGRGQADALRLVAKAHLMQDQAAQAMELAQAERAKFKTAKDARGQAAMWLTVAEVHVHNRSPTDALKAVREANDMLEKVSPKDLKMEAAVLLTEAKAHMLEELPGEALQAAEKAVAAYKEAGDGSGQVRAYRSLARTHMASDSTSEALQALQSALQLLQELADARSQADVLNAMADMHFLQERPDEALRVANQAQATSREVKHGIGEGEALNHIVRAYIEREDLVTALRLAKEGEERFMGRDDTVALALAKDALVKVYLASKDDEKALALRAGWEAMELVKALGQKRKLAQRLLVVATLHLANEQEYWAALAAQEARDIFVELSDKCGEGTAYQALAAAYAASDNSLDEAMAAADQARAIFSDLGDSRREAYAQVETAKVHRQAGDVRMALRAALRATSLHSSVGAKYDRAHALLVVAELHLAAGSTKSALRNASAALETYRGVDFKRGQASALQMMASAQLAAEEYDEAAQTAMEARTLRRRVEDSQGEADAQQLAVQSKLAGLMADIKVMQEITHELERNEKKRHFGPPPDMSAKVEEHNARLNTFQEAHTKAVVASKDALQLARATGDKALLIDSLRSYGQILVMGDKAQEALQAAEEAMTLARDSKDQYREAVSLALTAELHVKLHRPEIALDAADEALAMFKEMGNEAGEEYANSVLEIILGASPKPKKKKAEDTTAVAAASAAGPEQQGLDPDIVRQRLQDLAQELSGISDENAHVDVALMDAGMDSLSSVEFRNTVAKEFSMQMPSTLIFDYPTVRALEQFIVETSKPEEEEKQGDKVEEVAAVKEEEEEDTGPALSAGDRRKQLEAKLRLARDPQLKRPLIVGTWNGWVQNEMPFSDIDRCHSYTLRIGTNGWESFQIIDSGDWNRTLHPDKKDACPHAPYRLCGPDNRGHGRNWTVGKHEDDKAAEGVQYQVRLFLADDGGADKIDWVRGDFDKAPEVKEPGPRINGDRPWIAGTWANWAASKMTWDEDALCYQFDVVVGQDGWESFQILLNAEWKKCLHPDIRDSCHHAPHKMCGPDAEGHGLNWTIGRHPLDRGGKGASYTIRFFLSDAGLPDKVDWVPQEAVVG